MNFSEYKKKQDALSRKHHKEMALLATEFALANSPLKVGDFARDHIGTIKIERIRAVDHTKPQCVYQGPCYTTKGVPFKSGESRWVYQSNLKHSNGG